MSATDFTLTMTPAWSKVSIGSDLIAAADRDALGTTARIVVWPPRNLPGLLAVVDAEIARLDAEASRFRPDSEITALHESGAGRCQISEGLAEAVSIALAAAAWTGGLVDPTIGSALIALGYDRDFAAVAPRDDPVTPAMTAGWRAVRLCGRELTMPAGLRFDLGATAKGLGADRAAHAAFAAAGEGGVLISLGGDLAVAGRAPAGGWPVLIADEHRQTRAVRNIAARSTAARQGTAVPRSLVPPAHADPASAQEIRLGHGGLATSSVTCRQWLRAGKVMHHIVDPRTGLPAVGPWRTVSVAAASCAEANAASTAAVIAGHHAPAWLVGQGLPARLVAHDGRILRTGGWPRQDGALVDPPTASRLAIYQEGADQ